MRSLYLYLYRGIVHLHPPEFHNAFARDMLLDFEEALRFHGPAPLFRDALVSLARQWSVHIVAAAPVTAARSIPSLLAGDYIMIRDEAFTPLELLRGLIASATLVALCVFGFKIGDPTPPGSNLVYAASAGQEKNADQTRPKEYKTFDVVSIRENKTGNAGHVSFPMTSDDIYSPTGGYMHMTGLPIAAYIEFAWKMDIGQTSAMARMLPDWAKSSHYDIEARVDGEPTKDDMRRMMRALLEDRFQLSLHLETHETMVFDLMLAKPGKLGPTLQPHPAGDSLCTGTAPEGFFSPCHTVGFAMRNPKTETQRMAGRNIPMTAFLVYCSSLAGRPVIDKTGLTGTWDFTLEFVPPLPVNTAPDEPGPAGSTFEQAVKDQMGLTLVPDTGPVVSYVIDHIDRPSEN